MSLVEYDAFNNVSPAQVRATGMLGSVPLIVIAHDPDFEIAQSPSEQTKQDEAESLRQQQDISELSTRSCLLIARRSSHYVYDYRPDVVLKSVEKLVRVARSSATNLCDGLDGR